MSLQTPDDLLVVKIGPSQAPEMPEGGKWSSIDDLADESVEKKEVAITFDPPLDSFVKEIYQFMEYNKNYGDGWLTALKVKIVGSWTKKVATVHLADIGLIPGNYCESTV